MTAHIGSSGKPWAIAHRGARDEAPENTLTAFDRALAHPIDGIELDVQMSRDGRLVVYHDATLWRLGGGRSRVADLDFARLAGSKGREPPPTLEQVLSAIGGRTRLLIEIKSYERHRRLAHIEKMTEKVLALLEDHRHMLKGDRIFILSFDPQVLSLARRLAPRWRYVLNLSEEEPNMWIGTAGELPDGLWAVDVKISRLCAPLVQWARSGGMRVFTYTCNGPRQVNKALEKGVDAILSDRPGWLVRYLTSIAAGPIG